MEKKQKSFEQVLVESISHMRDVSLRDGVQSWDANRWPITNIIPCVEQLNKLAKEVKSHGGKFAPAELWGGGQVLQPAKFLQEDPLINLEEIHKAAPDIDLQCLYRGRQCFGFTPVSAEVQKDAIAAVADRGMKVFRIFDMMNDATNLEAGFKAVKDYRDAHPPKDPKDKIIIEGAISFITEPPDKGPRVWTHQDYADYAVTLAKMGADEIAVKNYAGVGHAEMPDLVKTIQKTLADNGFRDMPVNLHMHGKNTEILAEVLYPKKSGAPKVDVPDSNKGPASKVDVAFGSLSDGPSHTNAMDLLKVLMKRKGFDVDGEFKNRFEHHGIVQQMLQVEKTIDAQLAAAKLKEKRPPEITQDKLEDYRMAGGAMGDAWSRAAQADPDFYRFHREKNMKQYGIKEGTLPPLPVANTSEEARANGRYSAAALKAFREDIYDKMLKSGPSLWEKAGRFNTVTPGALILTVQSQQMVQNWMTGMPESMMDYTEPYMDVAAGRYGRNKGAETLEEAGKFRKAVLMFRALRKLNEFAASDPDYAQSMFESLTAARIPIIVEKKQTPQGEVRTIKLDDPALEKNLGNANIEQFRKAVTDAKDRKSWQGPGSQRAKLRESMLQETTPGKFPDPTDGREAGEAIVKRIEDRKGTGIDDMVIAGARLSSRKDMTLLAMMLRQNDKSGKPTDDSILGNLVDAATKEQTIAGQVEQSKSTGAVVGRGT
jgi:pyruvate/oxaloacetate carboxyltransferase